MDAYRQKVIADWHRARAAGEDVLDFILVKGESLWNGFDTFEILDADENVKAVVVGPESNLTSVSVFDHLTEPRDVDEYSIEPYHSAYGALYCLKRSIPGTRPFHLGEVRTPEEANFLINHIRSQR